MPKRSGAARVASNKNRISSTSSGLHCKGALSCFCYKFLHDTLHKRLDTKTLCSAR